MAHKNNSESCFASKKTITGKGLNLYSVNNTVVKRNSTSITLLIPTITTYKVTTCQLVSYPISSSDCRLTALYLIAIVAA